MEKIQPNKREKIFIAALISVALITLIICGVFLGDNWECVSSACKCAKSCAEFNMSYVNTPICQCVSPSCEVDWPDFGTSYVKCKENNTFVGEK